MLYVCDSGLPFDKTFYGVHYVNCIAPFKSPVLGLKCGMVEIHFCLLFYVVPEAHHKSHSVVN